MCHATAEDANAGPRNPRAASAGGLRSGYDHKPGNAQEQPVANAVLDATGIRVRDLPITLDKVMGGLPMAAE